VEWLKSAARKGLQKVHARQPTAQQLLNDLTQGLQPTEVSPGHSILPVGLGDGATSREHEEQHIDVVPQKEPYSLPPV
jgi:hypothetical protein